MRRRIRPASAISPGKHLISRRCNSYFVHKQDSEIRKIQREENKVVMHLKKEVKAGNQKAAVRARHVFVFGRECFLFWRAVMSSLLSQHTTPPLPPST